VLPLRYPWVWWSVGCLLAAGVTVGSLMPSSYIGNVAIRDKPLHLMTYLLLMLWFAGIYRRERHWILAIVIFAFGFVLDAAQSWTATRSFDLADVSANAGGILVGLVLAWFLFAGWCRRVEQFVFS
jgi:VanZ family protein